MSTDRCNAGSANHEPVNADSVAKAGGICLSAVVPAVLPGLLTTDGLQILRWSVLLGLAVGLLIRSWWAPLATIVVLTVVLVRYGIEDPVEYSVARESTALMRWAFVGEYLASFAISTLAGAATGRFGTRLLTRLSA